MRRAAANEVSRGHCPERSEGIAEAKAKPVAARPERATADEIVNDILCRFKNLFE